MTELETAFATNINEDKSEVYVRPQDLDGCGAEFIESLQPAEGKDLTGKGLVTLNMSYPHYFTVQRKCHVVETRRRMEQAFNSRCKVSLLQPDRSPSPTLRPDLAVLLEFNIRCKTALPSPNP